MAAPPPEQVAAWRVDLPAPRHDTLSGLRVAVLFESDVAAIDRGYLDVLRATADRLADAGAKVEDASLPVPMAEQCAMFNNLILPAISPSMGDEVGEAVSGTHYHWLQLQDERARLQHRWAEWFAAGIDVFLCPVTPTPAFPHNQDGDLMSRTMDVNGETRSYLENTTWTGLIGVVGLPSAVPPLGRTNAGLPVGVQVVVPYLQDRSAIRLAGLIAEAAGGGYAVPPIAR
jgi:amidase